VVNLSDVVLGAFRSAHVSYYAFAGHEGKGLMAEGLTWVVDHAFDHLGLHRVEANVQPDNIPSLRLVERCGSAGRATRPSTCSSTAPGATTSAGR